MTASNKDIPSNVDFATDVKTDRLDLLWRVTLGVSAVILLLTMAFALSSPVSLYVWLGIPLTLFVFCVLTNVILRRVGFEAAAITYTLGWSAALSVGMIEGTITTLHTLPYAFVFVVFVAGLLLRPSLTLLYSAVASVLIVAVPSLVAGGLDVIDSYHVFAVVLVFLSALLAAQVTGELYQVTEWALRNYQRERSTNEELFESRNELRRTLKRSEVLSEQLQESNDELAKAHAEAEAAKHFRGQFLANMSHELRTPLNAIIGFSETMLKFPIMYDNTELPDAYRADMTQIHTSGQHLLGLINDILDLARVDAGKLEIYMECVELRPVIDNVLATANGLVGSKPIELKSELPDPLPKVWADENRVRQVLVNLYSNAVKFTDSGSVTLKVCETDQGVQFSVTDTGCGIAEDQLGAIFEEFKQAESASGRDPRAGSGLGLTISRQLLDLMSGKIWGESEVGKGSTFYVVLQPYHKAKVDTLEAATIKRETTADPVPSSATEG